jgi:Siphovirus Gp157
MLSVEYWIERTANMLKANADSLRLRIAALLRDYPELENDEFLRADMIEGATDIDDVLTQIHRMVADAMALRDGTRARLEELSLRQSRMQKRIDFGRDLIVKVLEEANIRKIELPEATLSLRNNPQQLIGDPDPNTLPDELVKITRTVDKKKVREALERGEPVDGCALSNAPPSLLVKVK